VFGREEVNRAEKEEPSRTVLVHRATVHTVLIGISEGLVQFNYSRSGRNGIWLRVLQVQYARKDVGVGVGYCDDPTAMQAGFVPMLVVGSLGCSRCKSRCGCVLTVWYRNGSSFGTRGSAVSGEGRRGGAGQGRILLQRRAKSKLKSKEGKDGRQPRTTTTTTTSSSSRPVQPAGQWPRVCRRPSQLCEAACCSSRTWQPTERRPIRGRKGLLAAQ
jgi:hypothetical protein